MKMNNQLNRIVLRPPTIPHPPSTTLKLYPLLPVLDEDKFLEKLKEMEDEIEARGL